MQTTNNSVDKTTNAAMLAAAPAQAIQDADSVSNNSSADKAKRKHKDIDAISSSDADKKESSTVQRRGEEWEPETYYSEALGCNFTFPLSKFLSTYKYCNPAFRNSYRTHPCHRLNTAPPPPKAMKFDPPTFKFGNNEPDKMEKKEEPAKDDKKDDKPDGYDDYVIPSHVPGVYWSRREIDMLVESSNRWMRDLNNDSKNIDDRAVEAEKKATDAEETWKPESVGTKRVSDSPLGDFVFDGLKDVGPDE